MNERHQIIVHEQYKNLSKRSLNECLDSSLVSLAFIGLTVFILNHQPVDVVSYLTSGVTGVGAVTYGLDGVLAGIDAARYSSKAKKLKK